MPNRQQLLQQAEEARHVAGLVSYGPDKARLLARAQELRDAAEALLEGGPPPPRRA